MKPEIAQKSPYAVAVAVESGKTYYWCSCGKSKTQPFCDGAHQGSPFSPVAFTATENKTMYFCGCKITANQPFRDGAHSKL
jgi:CDGSH-type Zn-finger protein